MGVWKVKVILFHIVSRFLYVLCFTRPRYQVSFYRTIGPLVTIYGHGGHLGHVTRIMLTIFHCLVPESFLPKFSSEWPSSF